MMCKCFCFISFYVRYGICVFSSLHRGIRRARRKSFDEWRFSCFRKQSDCRRTAERCFHESGYFLIRYYVNRVSGRIRITDSNRNTHFFSDLFAALAGKFFVVPKILYQHFLIDYYHWRRLIRSIICDAKLHFDPWEKSRDKRLYPSSVSIQLLSRTVKPYFYYQK